MGRSDSPLLDRMVFLVGAQRSGTNWLQRMLAAHPGVATLPGETHLFTEGVDLLAARVQHGLLSSASTGTVFMDREVFLDAAREFCDTAFGGVAERLRPGARRVVERSPNHVERLDVIGEVYPDAWVLHIVRDGRDVTRSLVSQPWGPSTVAGAARLWARSVETAQAAAPALRRYREVRYEDLLADPAGRMRDVFGWLGLDVPDEAVAQVARAAGRAYNTDPRRPEVGTGKWRGDWSRRDVAAFERAAGDLNRRLGYPDGAAEPARRSVRGAVAPLGRRLVPRRTAEPPAVPLPLETRQRVVDRLVAAAAAGHPDRVVADLAADAEVRVVTPGGERTAEGPAGAALLADTVRADGDWGTQTRGEVPVAGPVWLTVLQHRGADGVARDRVVVVRFDAADRVTGLVLYRFGG